MPTRSRVISKGRSEKLKAKWDDPTVGPDGLTYRQRRSNEQRERMLGLNAAARSPTSGSSADQTPPATPVTIDPPANGASSGSTVITGGAPQDPSPAAPPAEMPAPPAPPPPAAVISNARPARVGRLFR